LQRAEVAGPRAREALARAGLIGDLCALDVESAITGNGSVKASEIAAVIAGDGATAPPHRALRVALFGVDEAGRFSPLEAGLRVATPQGVGGCAVQPQELGAAAVLAAAAGGGGVGRPTAAEGSTTAPE
jgi:hypothetical protein